MSGIDWQPGTSLVLESERFLLRSLAAADASDTYIGWWNDAEIQTSLGSAPRNWGRPEAVQHIAGFDNRRQFHLGVFPTGADVPIGFFSVFIEGAGRARTNVVIGDRDWWGRGVPLEVRARVMDFLFDSLDIVKVYGRVDGRNMASIFNYKAQGFTNEAILRQHSQGADGERHDLLMFGMLRAEWMARRADEDAE